VKSLDTKYDLDFVKNHAFETMEFYLPGCIDKNNGGYYQGYLRDSEIYERKTKDLIGTTRFIVDFSLLELFQKSNEYLELIEHGLEFLFDEHKDRKYGGYFQRVKGSNPVKGGRKKTYSHAFVLLALAVAYKAGLHEVGSEIEDIYELLEEAFWENKYGLYATESNRKFTELSSYRGQNANMHMVEALIAIYEATEKKEYIDRALTVAEKVTGELAKKAEGLVWEHYDSNWELNPGYNKEDPENIYRPFGFLPGHQIEWAKLLLILKRHKSKGWLYKRAKRLFSAALKYGRDETHGGIFYTFDFDREIINEDKYYWVHAEAIPTAFLLWLRTNREKYFKLYEKFWDYSLTNLVDSENGAWYRVLSRSGKPKEKKKSIPGKTDYHVINACYEIFRSYQLE